MSLYNRLDLTRPNRRKFKSPPQQNKPIWERIDLTRPVKLKCKVCGHRIQTTWSICPHCGCILQNTKTKRHCIWIQVCNLEVYDKDRDMWGIILTDAFSKVFSAFRSVNVFLTTDPPDFKEWQEDFTQVYVLADDSSVDYLGVASFSSRKVTNMAVVRIDQICNASLRADLSINQLSNLLANTIAHEIGHTLGLDHSDLDTDVMHDGVDHRVHCLMPPSFHGEQITLLNHAISKYKDK
ncbi:MAG: matrixin family metalloprotease [Crocosphaera sp.]